MITNVKHASVDSITIIIDYNFILVIRSHVFAFIFTFYRKQISKLLSDAAFATSIYRYHKIVSGALKGKEVELVQFPDAV